MDRITRNKLIMMLSQFWLQYKQAFPEDSAHDTILYHVQELQKLLFKGGE